MKMDVPENSQGKALDLEEHNEFDNVRDARRAFHSAREKLFDPSSWHLLTGHPKTVFQVWNKQIVPEHNLLHVGDFVRITTPAPSSSAGDGYDWVQVSEVKDDRSSGFEESCSLTLVVAINPEEPSKGIAHFFGDGASSSFIIRRQGCKLTAAYFGRNETPNTADKGIVDKIRNTVIALGAMAGISGIQWTALLKGLIGIS